MKKIVTFPDPVNGRLATALGTMRLRAIDAYPDEETRINRGHAIALMGGVELLADGTAMVQSQSYQDITYAVNGHCVCWDAQKAHHGWCKHVWAKNLLKKALALLTHPDPLDDLPTPYAFPTWFTIWQATYWLDGVPLNGIARTREDGHFDFTPDGMARSVILPYACLVLGPALTERAGVDDVVPSVEEAA